MEAPNVSLHQLNFAGRHVEPGPLGEFEGEKFLLETLSVRPSHQLQAKKTGNAVFPVNHKIPWLYVNKGIPGPMTIRARHPSS